MDLRNQWALIRADLERAANTLPKNASGHEAVRQYREFLDHNELELACDTLEQYARENNAGKEFWCALGDAAAKMQLIDHLARYQEQARKS